MNGAEQRRVAVWLDASEPQENMLQVVAGLGAAAEVLGLCFEDSNLLGLSELSVAREITADGGASERLDADGLERQLRAHARRLRQLFERAVAALPAQPTFRVARGELRAELLKLSDDCDILVLSHSRRHFAPRVSLRTRLADLLGAGPPTLVFVQERWRTGERAVAVFDGSDAAVAALRTAASIAATEELALSVWLPAVAGDALQDLKTRAASTLDESANYTFSTLAVDDVDALARAAEHENIRVMVLPDAGSALTRPKVADLLDRVSCSLIVVRSPWKP